MLTRPILSLVALALAASAMPASAGPALPDVAGPDVAVTTAPVATIEVFTDERYECTEGARARTVEVPDVAFDRVVLVFSSRPDGDPWDRLFGVAIGGVEVLRGTTPRTAFTLRKDVTEFAALLPRGGTTDVSLFMGSYVGALLGSVRLEFYADPQTAPLVREPAAHAVGVFAWRYLPSISRFNVAFPTEPRTGATIELTLSGHGDEEFWYLGNPVPRAFHVIVDGRVVATARAMPYVYALLGFGGGACGAGTNNQAVHTAMWWSAHQALDVAGIHTGNGEIPPYRADLDLATANLLQGARTVEVVQEGGTGNWVTSLAFLLR